MAHVADADPTRLGDTASWLVLALVLATLGSDGPRCALLLLGGASIALTVSQVLKRGVRRTRPSEAGLRGFAALSRDPDAFSFPSGHTAVAFAVAVALAGEGEGLAWVLLPLAAGIGTSRVYLGAHYPLDVIVGALIGTISGLLVRGVVDGSLLLGLQALAGLVSCM
jgi:undecaprenyl-diphosphatase